MSYTADMVGLLRTLAIIFLVFWGFRIFTRYVLPLFGRRAIKKAGQKMQYQAKANYQRAQQRNEHVIKDDGKVKISKSKPSSDQGDFVDFEEID